MSLAASFQRSGPWITLKSSGHDGMQFRPLGRTGLQLSSLSFGASSLGQEFRSVDLDEALRSVHVALDLGMNFIDTSPFYGRGLSECLLGDRAAGRASRPLLPGHQAGPIRAGPLRFLRPAGGRERGHQPPAAGRRLPRHHALPRHRIRGHGPQIVEETLPALQGIQKQGKVRFVGVSGYPMKTLPLRPGPHRPGRHPVLQPLHAPEHDAGRPGAVSEGEGRWHHERGAVLGPAADELDAAARGTRRRQEVRLICRRAAAHCDARGVDIAQLAVQYSVANPDMATCIVGSANPENVRKWVEWADTADRRDATGRGAGHPEADPQLVLHRRPPGEQRPAATVIVSGRENQPDESPAPWIRPRTGSASTSPARISPARARPWSASTASASAAPTSAATWARCRSSATRASRATSWASRCSTSATAWPTSARAIAARSSRTSTARTCYACRRGHTNCCEKHQTLGVHCDGGLRPRFLVPARKLHVSRKLAFEQLALVETLAIGCHAVNRSGLQSARIVPDHRRRPDRARRRWNSPS